MGIIQLKTSVWIEATPDTVWEVLTAEEHSRVWIGEYGEAAIARTGWKEGSEIVYFTPDGMGLFSRVVTSRPGETLVLRHEAVMRDFEKNTGEDWATPWIGLQDVYSLEIEECGTRLDVTQDIPEEHYESFVDMWEYCSANIKSRGESWREDRLELGKPIELLGLRVEDFPAGLENAFHRLQERLPHCHCRSFFGVFHLDDQGRMVYHVAAQSLQPGEAGSLGLEPIRIGAASFAKERIQDWRRDPGRIHAAFDRLGKDNPDARTPGIEWYQGQDVLCLLSINETSTSN